MRAFEVGLQRAGETLVLMACAFSVLEGRPVFLLRLGQLDIKGLLKAVGQDGIVKFVSAQPVRGG